MAGPSLWGGEPAAIGIDEAGRGPVLGPMVYAACYAPAADLERVAGLGFKDSKDLTEERRTELWRAVETDPRLAHAVPCIASISALSAALPLRTSGGQSGSAAT